MQSDIPFYLSLAKSLSRFPSVNQNDVTVLMYLILGKYMSSLAYFGINDTHLMYILVRQILPLQGGVKG